jgi:hypothetical protein
MPAQLRRDGEPEDLADGATGEAVDRRGQSQPVP